MARPFPFALNMPAVGSVKGRVPGKSRRSRQWAVERHLRRARNCTTFGRFVR